MPRDPRTIIYVGIKHFVVALDARTGAEVWRTKLKGSDFVTVLWDGETLVAANSGEVWGIDEKSGAVMWHNELKGLGRGLVSLVSSRTPGPSGPGDALAGKYRSIEQQRAAAAAAT